MLKTYFNVVHNDAWCREHADKGTSFQWIELCSSLHYFFSKAGYITVLDRKRSSVDQTLPTWTMFEGTLVDLVGVVPEHLVRQLLAYAHLVKR